MTATQSVVDVVARSLDAAEAAARDYGAFVTVFRERALAEARDSDSEPRRGPLHGVPVAVKDNVDVAGAWTRCGTPGFGHRLAREDAAVVARLRAAGAIVVGKTRMHELAWGMTTPGCRNPRDPGRLTGGSSGGSAAAVAAGAVPVALGTDTGGSIRNPAALCGVVGARVPGLPMDGVAPLAPTQDTVGVLAADSGYCARALEALGVPVAQHEPARVGLLSDRWAWRVEPEVADGLDRAVAALRQAGVTVSASELPLSGLAPSASYVTMLAEAAREWLRAGDPPEPGALGKEVRGLLDTGFRVERADHERALVAGRAIRAALVETLRHVDALLLPACPVVAAPAGAESVRCAGRDIPVTTAHSALTALASVAGVPALSVPAPNTKGLPVGVQLIAPDAGTLCSLAATVERASDGPPRREAQNDDRLELPTRGR